MLTCGRTEFRDSSPPGATKTGTGPTVAKKSENIFLPDIVFCAPAILHWRWPTVPRHVCNRVTGTRSRIPSLFARQCRRSSRTFDQRFASGCKHSTLSAAFVFGGAAILWMPRAGAESIRDGSKMGTAAPGFVKPQRKLIVGSGLTEARFWPSRPIWAVANAVTE